MNPEKRVWRKYGNGVGLLCVLIGVLGVGTQGTQAQITERVSVGANGLQGNFFSGEPVISGNGKIVAFSSRANNLVPENTNSRLNVFVRNLETKQTSLVSVSSTGEIGNENSGAQHGGIALSADGRYVTFVSAATNLVPEANQSLGHVFVHDRQTGNTTLVSINSSGNPIGGVLNYSIPSVAISPNGRFVAFISLLPYVPEDTNFTADLYVHDRDLQQTTLVSGNANGINQIGQIFITSPSLSADGRYVAFASSSSMLVSGDTNSSIDVFVHDRNLGQTIRASLNSQGEEGNGHVVAEIGGIALSADGRLVAFSSNATNMVEGDTNGGADVFVRDLDAGTTTRVSVTSEGVEAGGGSITPHLSADGRFVVFRSSAFNLVPPDELNGTDDVYLHDRQTGQTSRISMGLNDELGNLRSQSPQISADGRLIVFGSHANNLVEGDTNGVEDIFIHNRGLTSASEASRADLDGDGYADIVWRNTIDGSVVIWLMNGSTVLSQSSPGGVSTDWTIVSVNDMNGDGRADLVWRHISGTVVVWLMEGTTILSQGSPGSVSTDWAIVGANDMNGDGRADLVWRHTSGTVVVWLMEGTTILSQGSPGFVSTDWTIEAVNDLNGDGKADLVWRHTSGTVVVWLIDGTTILSQGSPGTGSTDEVIVGVNDLDGDGKADILWRNTVTGDLTVWWMNGLVKANSGVIAAGIPLAFKVVPTRDR